jgi:hypothetical protein
MKLSKYITLSMSAGLILLSVTGCATSTHDHASSLELCCLLFDPITMSGDDTAKTREGIIDHNIAWEELCGMEYTN